MDGASKGEQMVAGCAQPKPPPHCNGEAAFFTTASTESTPTPNPSPKALEEGLFSASAGTEGT